MLLVFGDDPAGDGVSSAVILWSDALRMDDLVEIIRQPILVFASALKLCFDR